MYYNLIIILELRVQISCDFFMQVLIFRINYTQTLQKTIRFNHDSTKLHYILVKKNQATLH